MQTSAAPPLIKVLTVDDHPLMRGGIVGEVNAQSDMKVVAEAANAKEAVDLFRQHRPDVTLMDVRMPGSSGIDAIIEIRRDFPRARIVVVTSYGGDVQAVRAFKAGAVGYLLKSTLRKELIDTIRSVHAGLRRIPPDIAGEIAKHIAEESLTERELSILKAVSGGNSNKIVADQLGITEHTVKGHMKSILSKLDANDRTHAVTIALQRGFLEI